MTTIKLNLLEARPSESNFLLTSLISRENHLSVKNVHVLIENLHLITN